MRLQSWLLLLALLASRAHGQLEPAPRPVDVWVSASIGGGSVRQSTASALAVRAAAWTSVGHAVFGVRGSRAGPFADAGKNLD